MTEDEMVGWHHQLDGHEFEQALGVGKEQESLERCSPWGSKKPDMTEQLKLTLKINYASIRNRFKNISILLKAR